MSLNAGDWSLGRSRGECHVSHAAASEALSAWQQSIALATGRS